MVKTIGGGKGRERQKGEREHAAWRKAREMQEAKDAEAERRRGEARGLGCGKRAGHLMSLTADVFHSETSPLNEDADVNIILRAREQRGAQG